MRASLLYNPRILCERLAIFSQQSRRLAKLRSTPARELALGHIDSLELLELLLPFGVEVIYDIGANVGTWTLLAKAVFPNARVEAFEPLGLHCLKFDKAVFGLPGIALHRVALGFKNEERLMHVTDFSDASSILPLSEKGRCEAGVNDRGVETVWVSRLDDFAVQHDLPSPCLIKLDVQGYELAVLQGAPRVLETTKAVIAEVSFVEFYQQQCLFHEVVEFLWDKGFQLYSFGVNTVTGSRIKQTDVLFLRRGFSK
jgi:FkbM family methyltransferase